MLDHPEIEHRSKRSADDLIARLAEDPNVSLIHTLAQVIVMIQPFDTLAQWVSCLSGSHTLEVWLKSRLSDKYTTNRARQAKLI